MNWRGIGAGGAMFLAAAALGIAGILESWPLLDPFLIGLGAAMLGAAWARP